MPRGHVTDRSLFCPHGPQCSQPVLRYDEFLWNTREKLKHIVTRFRRDCLFPSFCSLWWCLNAHGLGQLVFRCGVSRHAIWYVLDVLTHLSHIFVAYLSRLSVIFVAKSLPRRTSSMTWRSRKTSYRQTSRPPYRDSRLPNRTTRGVMLTSNRLVCHSQPIRR